MPDEDVSPRPERPRLFAPRRLAVRVILTLPVLIAAGLVVGLVAPHLPLGALSTVLSALILLALIGATSGILQADWFLLLTSGLGLVVLAYFYMGNMHPVLLLCGLYALLVAAAFYILGRSASPPHDETR